MTIKHYEYIDQLVIKTQAGDDEALLKIIEYYRPLLKTSIRYCLASYPSASPYAEDIEADLFLILRELVRKYDSELSFFSYFLSTRIDYALRTYVKAHYVDVTNGGRRPQEVSIEELPQDWEPFVDADPVGKIIEGASIALALAQLEQKYRDAVQIYFFDGLNQQQASERLGITQPAFSKRLNKALTLLRGLIGEF